jgi:hypothetical protein
MTPVSFLLRLRNYDIFISATDSHVERLFCLTRLSHSFAFAHCSRDVSALNRYGLFSQACLSCFIYFRSDAQFVSEDYDHALVMP